MYEPYRGRKERGGEGREEGGTEGRGREGGGREGRGWDDNWPLLTMLHF